MVCVKKVCSLLQLSSELNCEPQLCLGQIQP